MKLIKTDGTETEFSYKTDDHLKELQNAVGGYIERIVLPGDKVLVVNEEGLIHGLPANNIITARLGNLILGDVVFGLDSEVFSNEDED